LKTKRSFSLIHWERKKTPNGNINVRGKEIFVNYDLEEGERITESLGDDKCWPITK